MSKWITRDCLPMAGAFGFVAAKRIIDGPDVVSTGAAIMYLAIAIILFFVGVKYDRQTRK